MVGLTILLMLRSPHPKKVIVERMPAPVQSGAIFIPEEARQKGMDGKVVAIGNDVRDLEVNQQVLVNWQYGGTDAFTRDGLDYWVLNEHQVLAVINP